ncbi:uncharacterized protein LOC111623902 [Centruroides sculpturatus]|uniref:uncharacterized protein LOC111623902 n=1 Tax=Centruroides sculpturatus TaxID=218467 RepID=UPI000C6E30B2|nr:uncharacterized protein LOC111623902 [Centruroides sculpturatus]XP_023222411.1 uncharacterized protein LOC111623902 [Centruroides sculpturatus]
MEKKVFSNSKSAVFEYYKLTTDGKYYQCKCIVENDDGKHVCEAKISAFASSEKKNAPTRAGNLKRHLQRLHPKILQEVNEKDNSRNTSSILKLENIQKLSSVQTQVCKFFASDKVTVTMTGAKFKNLIIEMVVQDSVPLIFFSRPAFLGLNGEMARKLGVSLDRENIRRLIIEEAVLKKDELWKRLKDRLIFIKMDACTRHRVNYFAIDVLFIDENNTIVTKTLAVKDTMAHHTGEYLQKLVQEVLEDFKIKKENILCIVTDNASNMLKITEKMNQDNEIPLEDIHEIFSIDTQIEPIIEKEEYLDDIVEEASSMFQIQHMRCAVHTLQLAIRDGLKDSQVAKIITKLIKTSSYCS